MIVGSKATMSTTGFLLLTSAAQDPTYMPTSTIHSDILEASGHQKSSSTTISRGPVVSDEILSYFEIIVDFWILLAISCLGIVTNSINIVVFFRQGFKETINISLTAIALWDLIKCLVGVAYRLHGPVGLAEPLAGLFWSRVGFPYVAYISVFSGYISYALITYVSIERCLCVALPFDVKFIFTKNFTFFMLTLLSVSVFGAFVVMLFLYETVYEFSPYYNASIPQNIYNDFFKAHPVIMVYYKLIGIVVPSSSFVVLCVSSAVTVFYLKKLHQIHHKSFNSKSRADSASSASTMISLREKQVVKTLLIVILVYMGNLFPRIACQYIPGLIEPEYYILRKYHNLWQVVSFTVFILDYINASINMFIFLNMSTNFRATFFTIFPKWF